MIESHGGRNQSGVSANTDYLLAGDRIGPAKLNKARKLGVRIIGEEDFVRMLSGDMPDAAVAPGDKENPPGPEPPDVDDNVKVYEAYRYEKTENAKDPQSQGTVYLRQLKYIPANMGVVLVGKQPAEGTFSDVDKLDFFLREAPADMLEEGDNYKAVWTKADDYVNDEWNNYLQPTVTANDNLGNADTDADGKILHRFFGLANFHSTKYYKENQTGDDYIGFFRLTPNGRSDANKAYLSIPANKTVDGGVGATFGFIDFNGQFLGNETDDPKKPSLAKMAIVFDDEDDGGSTTTVTEVKPNSTDGDASFYTLQGVKVSRPVKGVYIHNGKKFIK